MKIPFTKSIFSAVSLLSLTLSPVALRAEQPQMNKAIEELREARKGRPIEHLEIAKRHLEEAAHNKGGERVEAIHQINEAITAARKDEHKRMEEHIDRAIEACREGKEDARRKK